MTTDTPSVEREQVKVAPLEVCERNGCVQRAITGENCPAWQCKCAIVNPQPAASPSVGAGARGDAGSYPRHGMSRRLELAADAILERAPELVASAMRDGAQCIDVLWNSNTAMKATLASQAARVAELEKDAARYRWLRNQSNGAPETTPTVYDRQWYPSSNYIDRGRVIDGEELDAAIDALLRADGLPGDAE